MYSYTCIAALLGTHTYTASYVCVYVQVNSCCVCRTAAVTASIQASSVRPFVLRESPRVRVCLYVVGAESVSKKKSK